VSGLRPRVKTSSVVAGGGVGIFPAFPVLRYSVLQLGVPIRLGPVMGVAEFFPKRTTPSNSRGENTAGRNMHRVKWQMP
jgi:hypothetical protein